MNSFISFEYQWTYIFRNKLWLTLSSTLLSLLLFHKITLLNRHFWVRSLHLWILYHHISPLQCHFLKFAGVAMKCTLHCHSILNHSIATLEWHCSVNLHICDAIQCHFGGTLHCHSQSTLQCHSGVHTPLPLRYYHSNATPTVHSNATSECLWSVNLHICDALLCHSNATP